MALASDPVPQVRMRYLNKVVSTLNDTLGITDTTLVLDLIALVNKMKNDSDKDIGD